MSYVSDFITMLPALAYFSFMFLLGCIVAQIYEYIQRKKELKRKRFNLQLRHIESDYYAREMNKLYDKIIIEEIINSDFSKEVC